MSYQEVVEDVIFTRVLQKVRNFTGGNIFNRYALVDVTYFRVF